MLASVHIFQRTTMQLSSFARFPTNENICFILTRTSPFDDVISTQITKEAMRFSFHALIFEYKLYNYLHNKCIESTRNGDADIVSSFVMHICKCVAIH